MGAIVESSVEGLDAGPLYEGTLEVKLATSEGRLAKVSGRATEESRAETRFLFFFRVISIAAFALTCLIGFLVHRTGVEFLQGF